MGQLNESLLGRAVECVKSGLLGAAVRYASERGGPFFAERAAKATGPGCYASCSCCAVRVLSTGRFRRWAVLMNALAGQQDCTDECTASAQQAAGRSELLGCSCARSECAHLAGLSGRNERNFEIFFRSIFR
jgi:hypothetical protein